MKSSPSLKAIALFVIIWALITMAVSLPYISMGPEEKAPDLQLKGGGGTGVAEGSGDILSTLYMAFVGILVILSVIYAVMSFLHKDSQILKEIAAGFIVMLVLGGIIVLAQYLSDSSEPGVTQSANRTGEAGNANVTTTEKPAGALQYSVIAIGMVLAAVIAVKMAFALRSKKTLKVEDRGEELIRKINAAMNELEGGKKVQEVIIRAYEEMCRVLGKSGVKDRDSFTPREFEKEIIRQMDIDPEPVARLTGLFEEAKYSSHPIDDSKRRDAIRALKDLKKEVEEYQTFTVSSGYEDKRNGKTVGRGGEL